MKTLIAVSVVITALLGIVGLYLSIQADMLTPPVVATASK